MTLVCLTLGIVCYYSFLTLVMGFVWDALIILLYGIMVTVATLFVTFLKQKLLLKLILLLVLYCLILPIPFNTMPNFQKTVRIDSCIDNGGVWDSMRNYCRMNDTK